MVEALMKYWKRIVLISALLVFTASCSPTQSVEAQQGMYTATFLGTFNGYNHFRVDHPGVECYTLGSSISCLRKVAP